MYEVTIADEPARRLIGLPHQGPYQAIGVAFERLDALAHGGGLALSGPMIAVYYDDPLNVPEAQLRAFAARETSATAAPQGELECRDLAGGAVASIVHKGPYAGLAQAYDWLYRAWLPGSGREPADAPAYEIYLNDPQTTPPTEWLTRIVMPLKA